MEPFTTKVTDFVRRGRREELVKIRVTVKRPFPTTLYGLFRGNKGLGGECGPVEYEIGNGKVVNRNSSGLIRKLQLLIDFQSKGGI